MKRLAVIPARGGSKRIPQKNIKLFCGKPIMAWSIETALASACFDAVIVSTDDEKIAAVARQYGAEVPFIRPAPLADDYCGTQAVVQHALQFFAQQNRIFEQTCCIYATAPLLTADVVQEGCDILTTNDCDYVVTVTGFSFPVQRAMFCLGTGHLAPFYPEQMRQRSQDLVPSYHDAGQLYWGRSQAFLTGQELWATRTLPLILPEIRVQDIDTLTDWQIAELKHQLAIEEPVVGER